MKAPEKSVAEPWLLPAGRVVLEQRISTLLDAGGYGGHPFLGPDEPLPCCGECDQPLAFVAHFKAHERHWRFFYCFECNPWDDRDRKRGECVFDEMPEGAIRAREGQQLEAFAWNVLPVLSPPLLEDEDSIEGALPESYAAWIGAALEERGLEEASEVLQVFEAWGAWALPGTQVGGYAHPIQNEILPLCPECSGHMDLLVRLDTEDQVGLMWGDMGAVYLHACRAHPQQVHFNLQCY